MQKLIVVAVVLFLVFVASIALPAEKKKKVKKEPQKTEEVKTDAGRIDIKELPPGGRVEDDDLALAAQDKTSVYKLRKLIGQEERDINAVDSVEKRCVLSWAILAGNKESVEFLLAIAEKRKLKLDLDSKDKHGKSPRDYASEKGFSL